jgi:protein gp37
MGDTKIPWAQKVWNPVTGCTPVSRGCEHCYAARFARRLAGRCGYPADKPFAVTLHPERLDEPLHWRKPSRIFVCSMGDLFHPAVPDEFVDRVLARISNCPRHTFIVLTKRAERITEYLLDLHERGGITRLKKQHVMVAHDHGLPDSFAWPLPNLWPGVSVEDQATADERIPILMQIPAAVHIVSLEPMLGPITLRLEWIWNSQYTGTQTHPDFISDILIDWVIIGGETGPGARPMHPDWVRKVRDQCAAADVPFFFKSWGEWSAGNPASEHRGVVAPDGQWWKGTPFGYGRDHPGSVELWRCGKVKAGRMLDGRMHEEFPETLRGGGGKGDQR